MAARGNRTKLTVAAAVAAGAFLTTAGALTLAQPGAADAGVHVGPRSSFTLHQAEQVTEHPVYNVGDRFEGLPLTAVLRRNDSAEYVSFIYGTCDTTLAGSCLPPAEIQVWPACKRNLARYDASVPGTPTPQRVSIRGTTAAFVDTDGLWLEIQTGRATIVVFSDSKERILRLARALRGVNISQAPENSLPPPAPGAVEGTLTCS